MLMYFFLSSDKHVLALTNKHVTALVLFVIVLVLCISYVLIN